MNIDTIIKTIQEFIKHNPNMAIAIAVGMILIAALILRKLKIFAIILIIAASILIYLMLHSNVKFEKPDINKIKEKTKARVMENIK